MKRRISSDTLIPVRLASFLSAAIWESERNMEMRFILCIYVGHTFLSRTKRTRIENKFAGLESTLHANRRVKARQIFQRSSAHFTGSVRSRRNRKDLRNCRASRGMKGAELSGVESKESR